jgi:hypothetical protein
MCTVSFVKSVDKIIITSNRDEAVMRPSAMPPQNYTVNGKTLFSKRHESWAELGML